MLNRTAEIGIYLESHRCSGLELSQFFNVLIGYKGVLYLRKILARALSSNTGTLRLSEKIGFHQEEVLPLQYWTGNASHNAKILSQFI